MEKKNEEKNDAELLSIDGREVSVTRPDKLYFSKQLKLSKRHLVQYCLSIARGALIGVRDRPIVLKRFVNGAEGEPWNGAHRSWQARSGGRGAAWRLPRLQPER